MITLSAPRRRRGSAQSHFASSLSRPSRRWSSALLVRRSVSDSLATSSHFSSSQCSSSSLSVSRVKNVQDAAFSTHSYSATTAAADDVCASVRSAESTAAEATFPVQLSRPPVNFLSDPYSLYFPAFIAWLEGFSASAACKLLLRAVPAGGSSCITAEAPEAGANRDVKKQQTVNVTLLHDEAQQELPLSPTTDQNSSRHCAKKSERLMQRLLSHNIQQQYVIYDLLAAEGAFSLDATKVPTWLCSVAAASLAVAAAELEAGIAYTSKTQGLPQHCRCAVALRACSAVSETVAAAGGVIGGDCFAMRSKKRESFHTSSRHDFFRCSLQLPTDVLRALRRGFFTFDASVLLQLLLLSHEQQQLLLGGRLEGDSKSSRGVAGDGDKKSETFVSHTARLLQLIRRRHRRDVGGVKRLYELVAAAAHCQNVAVVHRHTLNLRRIRAYILGAVAQQQQLHYEKQILQGQSLLQLELPQLQKVFPQQPLSHIPNKATFHALHDREADSEQDERQAVYSNHIHARPSACWKNSSQYYDSSPLVTAVATSAKEVEARAVRSSFDSTLPAPVAFNDNHMSSMFSAQYKQEETDTRKRESCCCDACTVYPPCVAIAAAVQVLLPPSVGLSLGFVYWRVCFLLQHRLQLPPLRSRVPFGSRKKSNTNVCSDKSDFEIHGATESTESRAGARFYCRGEKDASRRRNETCQTEPRLCSWPMLQPALQSLEKLGIGICCFASVDRLLLQLLMLLYGSMQWSTAESILLTSTRKCVEQGHFVSEKFLKRKDCASTPSAATIAAAAEAASTLRLPQWCVTGSAALERYCSKLETSSIAALRKSGDEHRTARLLFVKGISSKKRIGDGCNFDYLEHRILFQANSIQERLLGKRKCNITAGATREAVFTPRNFFNLAKTRRSGRKPGGVHISSLVSAGYVVFSQLGESWVSTLLRVFYAFLCCFSSPERFQLCLLYLWELALFSSNICSTDSEMKSLCKERCCCYRDESSSECCCRRILKCTVDKHASSKRCIWAKSYPSSQFRRGIADTESSVYEPRVTTAADGYPDPNASNSRHAVNNSISDFCRLMHELLVQPRSQSHANDGSRRTLSNRNLNLSSSEQQLSQKACHESIRKQQGTTCPMKDEYNDLQVPQRKEARQRQLLLFFAACEAAFLELVDERNGHNTGESNHRAKSNAYELRAMVELGNGEERRKRSSSTAGRSVCSSVHHTQHLHNQPQKFELLQRHDASAAALAEHARLFIKRCCAFGASLIEQHVVQCCRSCVVEEGGGTRLSVCHFE